MKRFLSLILVLALCLSVGIPALAADVSDFTDVKEGDYYYDAVAWALEKGVTNGVSGTEFGAALLLTRAQTVTFLWRLAGSPMLEATSTFADVEAGSWYSDAVSWAAVNGIVKGYSAEQFGPDDTCTREQAATFLYRYEKLRGGGFEEGWTYELDYTDRDSISAYAVEPLSWMTKQGVMQGYAGALDPKGKCNRAQFVTMLCRFDGGTAPEEPEFVDKAVPVIRDTLDSTETATLRFYKDMPNVPYMKLPDFYNRFYLVCTERTEGMTEAKTGSRSVYTNFGGYTMTADADADILTSDDFMNFHVMGYYLELELTGEEDENYPFLAAGETETTPEEPVPLTMRLCDYGIDLRAEEDGIWFPVGTLSDLFADSTLYYVVWNGEKLYTLDDYGGIYQSHNAMYDDEHFCDPMAAGRSADMADFAYRELCFNIDVFYGKPGQEVIHDALSASTLDQVLSSQYPRVKELLRSTDPKEYMGSLYLLFYGLLSDGGHTWGDTFIPNVVGVCDEAWTLLYSEPYYSGLNGMYYSYDVYDVLRPMQEELYGDDYYLEQGDTALIRFDGFTIDYDGWKAYYAGTGELPCEDDAIGTIYAGLQRAAANPEIKNVVFDISTNGGGDTGAMQAIEQMTLGVNYMIYRNSVSGQTCKSGYLFDANFDGVFDELDQPFSQFRYGVLTSCYSFSCANAFPWFMHDHGAMILGERSGGGACCIRISSTADGFVFCSSYSSYFMLNDAMETVDTGCPLDADLVQEGDAPYAAFYDLTGISAQMNAFFGEAEDAA